VTPAPPLEVPAPAALREPPIALVDAGDLGETQRGDAEAALGALQPVLQRCFEDDGARFRGERRLRVRFVLESTQGLGRARGARLEGAPMRDPVLAACLEDVFDELKLPAPRSDAAFDVGAQLRFSGRAPPERLR
jgi:hypothetical protein